MDIQPLISIVMPAYNCEKYIIQAVNSVKEQTYRNWELIIIEDVSTDCTWSVIENLANDKIHVYRNKTNCGVAQTRNRGIELALGVWVAFLDSDDLWAPCKLEKQVALINQKGDAQLLFTGSAFVTETGTKLNYVLHVPEKITQKKLIKQNLISCSSVLVRTKLLKQYPMPPVRLIHEDFAVWLQILGEIPFAYGIDEPLLIYRISSASKSGNKIKAAKMNWNTYQYVKLGTLRSIYFMVIYTLNGLKKYLSLFFAKKMKKHPQKWG